MPSKLPSDFNATPGDWLDAIPPDLQRSLRDDPAIVEWYAQLPLVERERFAALLIAVVQASRDNVNMGAGIAAKAKIGGFDVCVKVLASVSVKYRPLEQRKSWFGRTFTGLFGKR